MNLRRFAALWLLWGLGITAHAAPLPLRDVPEPLKPWIPWVMQGQASRFCPPTHDGGRRLCNWPSRIALELDAEGGRFEMGVTQLAPGWAMLPGDGPRWPQEVNVDGKAAPVLDRDGIPALWLETGTHRVQGRFAWKALPESLRVPPEAGLIELNLNGRAVSHPQRDERQQLWLGRRAVAAAAQAERLELRVFRMIDDDIPLTVTTQIEIDAGGEVREETLGPVLLPGLLPLTLSGDLPARLEDDGSVRVQLRPGLWRLTVVARSTAPVTQLTAAPAHEQWAAQEIWSLQAHHELRVIEPSGVPPTDPRQVGVPAEWQGMPAFLVEPGNTLKLTETQRGSPDLTPDQLTLQRQLWLDFDGGGFTVQDQLSGRLARTWRLEAQAPIALGRVQVDNEPQLITKHDQGVGVEVRHGALNLTADSRIEDGARRIPAAGWNTDLQGIDATLHLPPAWRLIAAPGVDNVPDTWLSRWSLLDLFLVLIASIAALRLFGRGTAALTLVTLALTWHEPDAPRWAWLNLIAAIALLRALPASFDGSGRLRKLLFGYQWLAAGILALVALPFAVQQARVSLYPQLEIAYGYANIGGLAQQAKVGMVANQEMAQMESDAVAPMAMPAPAPPMVDEVRRYKGEVSSRAKSAYGNVSQASIQKLDPNVLTQTGPGLPAWGWRQASLSWSGPVTPDQDFHLWLMPPWLTRTLGGLSIALIAVLAMSWLQVAPRLPRLPMRSAAAAVLSVGAALVLLGASSTTARAQDANALMPPQPPQPPPPAVLDELRERLTALPDCLPSCANWSRLQLDVSGGERLTLRLIAEAQVETALPLPVPRVSAGQSRVWQPQAVLLDDRAADLLRDESGALWLRVPAGRHTVAVSGDLTGFAQVQLPTTPAPRQASSESAGWLVTGIDGQGQPGSVIDLIREQRDDASTSAASASEEGGSSQQLPPLLRLTRTLQLGLVWSAESTLMRHGSAQGASIVTLAALPGEVVTGDSVRVVGGRIQASFAPGQREVSWSSRLATVEELALEANTASEIIETWRFDVSPLWHADFSGLAAVSNQEGDWRLVTFRPWPGEKVQAQISRPGAVQGQVMTLDAAELHVQPGQRATDYTLSLTMRASQGGQHAIKLPAGLALQGLDIDGQAQPARVEGERVILPIRPGAQNIALRLRADEGLGSWLALTSTPALDTGTPGVNARIDVQLPPRDRWILLAGGPALGPAVLFWGVLAVLVAVAIALGRVGLTPLKGLQWALLMVGLSQIPIAGAAVVAGWLFALALRARVPASWSAGRFNLLQVVLAIWTVAALSTLAGAVAQGLLGEPDMQIAGNGSSAYQLMWYQDRFHAALPRAWVLSVSIWFYRGLMLIWALWLANSLLNWLRWGWSQYSEGGLWRKKAAVVAPPAATAGESS